MISSSKEMCHSTNTSSKRSLYGAVGKILSVTALLVGTCAPAVEGLKLSLMTERPTAGQSVTVENPLESLGPEKPMMLADLNLEYTWILENLFSIVLTEMGTQYRKLGQALGGAEPRLEMQPSEWREPLCQVKSPRRLFIANFSPLQKVTLPDDVKRTLNLEGAEFFTWMSPLWFLQEQERYDGAFIFGPNYVGRQQAVLDWLVTLGGYVYFDSSLNIKAVRAVVGGVLPHNVESYPLYVSKMGGGPSLEGEDMATYYNKNVYPYLNEDKGMRVGAGVMFKKMMTHVFSQTTGGELDAQVKSLYNQERFQPITLPVGQRLKTKYNDQVSTIKFGWVNPSEVRVFSDMGMAFDPFPNGAFIYLYENEDGYLYENEDGEVMISKTIGWDYIAVVDYNAHESREDDGVDEDGATQLQKDLTVYKDLLLQKIKNDDIVPISEGIAKMVAKEVPDAKGEQEVSEDIAKMVAKENMMSGLVLAHMLHLQDKSYFETY